MKETLTDLISRNKTIFCQSRQGKDGDNMQLLGLDGDRNYNFMVHGFATVLGIRHWISFEMIKQKYMPESKQ